MTATNLRRFFLTALGLWVASCVRQKSPPKPASAEAIRASRVEIAVNGAGRILVNGSAAACPPQCQFDVPKNSSITLKAQPDANAVFKGWHGGCGGDEMSCVVTAPARVMARFESVLNEPLWIHQFGIIGHGVSNEMAVDAQRDAVFLLATVYSSVPWGDLSFVGAGHGDALIYSVSREGTRRWGKLIGSSSDDMASDLVIGANGDLFVVVFLGGSATVDGHHVHGPAIAIFRLRGSDGKVMSVVELPDDLVWPVRISASGESVFVLGSPRRGNIDARLSKLDVDPVGIVWTKDVSVGRVRADGLSLQMASDASILSIAGGHKGYNKIEIVAIEPSSGVEHWRRSVKCSLGCNANRLRDEANGICIGGVFGGKFQQGHRRAIEVRKPNLGGFIACWSRSGEPSSLQRTDVPVSDFARFGETQVVVGIDLVDNEWRAILCNATKKGACARATVFNYVRSIKAPFRLAYCGHERACLMGTFVGPLGVGGLTSPKNGDVFFGAFDSKGR